MPAGSGPRPSLVRERVWEVLDHIVDPEIRQLSIRQLGMVQSVSQPSQDTLEIVLRPTFSGCPALDIIRASVRLEVSRALDWPLEAVNVVYAFDQRWNTERISDSGRASLIRSGISPPADQPGERTVCPFCRSSRVVLTSRFGATRCRQQYLCQACRTPFEGIKPLG